MLSANCMQMGFFFGSNLWWQQLSTWPRTLLAATIWICFSRSVSLEHVLMVAKTLRALVTFLRCSGTDHISRISAQAHWTETLVKFGCVKLNILWAIVLMTWLETAAVPAFSTLARHVFNPHDDALLKHLRDDNARIEPEWYMPILPMVLVNGADGIGTGWSTKIPNYDIREIVNNLRLMLDGREPLPMVNSSSATRRKCLLTSFSELNFICNSLKVMCHCYN